MTFEDLKNKAVQLALTYCSGKEISEQEKSGFLTEFRDLACRYQIDDEVWYLDEMKIIRCRVIKRSCNQCGYPVYRIVEYTGRFVGDDIPECLLFHSKEEIVAALQEVIAERR